MPPVFTRRADFLLRTFIAAALLGLAGVIWFSIEWFRSGYYTKTGRAVEQPIPFSHAHHVADDGLDCRFCHASVTRSQFAGIPTTDTCMTCHWQLWTQATVLAPLRESWRTGMPLHWQRVHDLPDYVYFDHSIHVAKGMGCSSCHGRVDRMPLVFKVNTLLMQWCLGCHRNPAAQVRPRELVFDMAWKPPPDQSRRGGALVREYGIRTLQSCSDCHR